MNDAFVIGQECFDDLAMCSFFQDFQKDESNNSIMKCKMHDIVHDFAQFLTKNECFMLEMEVVRHSTKTESYKGNYFRHLVVVLEKESPFPSRIYNVHKLRRLFIKSYNKNSSTGGAFPKLSNGSDGNKAFTLANLSNLSYPRGDLKIRGLENAADVTEARKAKLGLILNFDLSTGLLGE
ncbi:hypothetical protein HRI_003507900 [Hibiscus trionum]|uniref:Disease resistance protein winged helix domain-containing protein n=1 Tax=Hibiscus trionum TaxID=183268 RepID=A0A9W7IMG7_HIBTR|nr:hypothetical protein HRI_003507900 [Hibiscus trionum]